VKKSFAKGPKIIDLRGENGGSPVIKMMLSKSAKKVGKSQLKKVGRPTFITI